MLKEENNKVIYTNSKWSYLWFALWNMKKEKKWKRFVSEIMVEVVYPMVQRKEIKVVCINGEFCIIQGDRWDEYKTI